jgi:hypothetical protein
VFYFTYICAAYYVIVCFSTIGYGDIIPFNVAARFTMVAIIISNLTVLSNFLTQLIEILFQRSSFERKCKYNDHLVIIGELPEYFLADLLQEIFNL